MRCLGPLFLTFSIALLSLGCGSNDPAPTASEAKQKIQDAADENAEAGKLKDDYARDVRKQLDEFDKKYAALQRSAAKADGAAKNDLEKKIDVAKSKRDEASRKLDALNLAGGDRWPKAKDELETALADVKKAFEE